MNNDQTTSDTSRKKNYPQGDEKKHPTKKDIFNKGQSLREDDSDENGIVVTPKNPDSQEWHAREDVKRDN